MDSVKAHYGIALVLDEQEIEGFAEKYADENGEDMDEVLENIMFGDPLSQNGNGEDPSLEIKEICNDNVHGGIRFFNWENDGECEHKEECWAVFADKQLTGQNIFMRPPYKSMDCLVTEFKSKLNRYMPDQFDYHSHIGFLVYCAIS